MRYHYLAVLSSKTAIQSIHEWSPIVSLSRDSPKKWMNPSVLLLLLQLSSQLSMERCLHDLRKTTEQSSEASSKSGGLWRLPKHCEGWCHSCHNLETSFYSIPKEDENGPSWQNGTKWPWREGQALHRLDMSVSNWRKTMKVSGALYW